MSTIRYRIIKPVIFCISQGVRPKVLYYFLNEDANMRTTFIQKLLSIRPEKACGIAESHN